MNETEKYFIQLLSAHINNESPKPLKDVDWRGIFRLGELHCVHAMLTLSIKKLPIEYRPKKEIMSAFNQTLGLTLQSYEYKIEGINILHNALINNGVKHMFIKGAEMRDLYPVKEVRTSGDCDVIIEENSLDKVNSILTEKGFETELRTSKQDVMKYNDEEYEIKTEFDYINEKVKKYFESPFDSTLSYSDNSFTYHLYPINHLLYIVIHMLRHIKAGGAGVRQLMDIDIMLRSYDIDLNSFFGICTELDIEKSSKVLISLTKDLFNTPINFEYKIDDELFEKLTSVILTGGVFGFKNNDIGSVRLMKNMNDKNVNSKLTSYKALLSLFYVDKDSLKNSYKYAKKHPLLLPAAYFNRLYSAVFKRGKQNVKHINSMFTKRENAVQLYELTKELEIL